MKSLALVALGFGLVATGLRAGEPGWDKKKAAARLDERAQWWMEEGGSKLATDAGGDTACLCCHTTAPYALARPALAKSLQASSPATAASPLPDKLLKDVDRRLVAWPTVAHMYEFTADKTKESKGTEAILSVLMVAWNDAARGETGPTPASKRAFERLWELQRADGGWDWLRFSLEPWETRGAEYFGAALAALAVGTAPGYYTATPGTALQAKVDSLRSYLKANRDKENYYAETWLLLASTKLRGLLEPAERAAVINSLGARQKTDGDDAGGWVLKKLAKWRYDTDPPTPAPSPTLDPKTDRPDGYATGLIVYTLLRAGVAPGDAKVAAGLSWLKKHQQADGSWPAESINKTRSATNRAKAFMSDAATAWAVLALLEAEPL